MTASGVWQFMLEGEQEGQGGSAGGHCPRQDSSAMLCTWTKVLSSTHTRKELVTQMEHLQNHAVVQASGSRECQNLVLLPEGSRDNCVRCHQADDPSGGAER